MLAPVVETKAFLPKAVLLLVLVIAVPALYPNKVLLSPLVIESPPLVPATVFRLESLVTPPDIPVKLEPSPYSVSAYKFLTLVAFAPIS